MLPTYHSILIYFMRIMIHILLSSTIELFIIYYIFYVLVIYLFYKKKVSSHSKLGQQQ